MSCYGWAITWLSSVGCSIMLFLTVDCPRVFFRLFLLLGRKTIGFNKSVLRQPHESLPCAGAFRTKSPNSWPRLNVWGCSHTTRSKSEGSRLKNCSVPERNPVAQSRCDVYMRCCRCFESRGRAVGPLYGKLIASWVATGKRGQKPKCHAMDGGRVRRDGR